MKKMQWPVLIKEVDNGYVVQVGCVELVFETREKLIEQLAAYMNGTNTSLIEKLKEEKMPQTLQAPPQALGLEACVNR